MESYKIENLSFTYPLSQNKTLDNISFTVKQGEFVVICGKSGCGKTTLLRLLKTALAPVGKQEGSIYFNGKPLSECDALLQSSAIGFVMQNPDNQIVTDKVWHELAFGLESLGYKQSEIRTRVSEMASFFGIQNWFYKNVTELSGGQKQLLNVASVMAMQPSVLIVDEPTSQLDPIAADEFFKTLEKINRELGVSVILTEHRLEDCFYMADKVIVMDKGKIIAQDEPRRVGKILKEKNHDMYSALPTPIRVHSEVENNLLCPLTVRDGRMWLEEYSKNGILYSDLIPKDNLPVSTETVIEVKDVWFRYEKNLPDVLKGFNLTVNKGELFCLLGGNGTGKTTALSLVSGLYTPYRGDIKIKGQSIGKLKNLYSGLLGVLPQNPQSVFVKKTVYLDLLEILSQTGLSKEEQHQKVYDIAYICNIHNLLDRHPYDLSGGEQQRAALAKILLMNPEILLVDEPTKGMDAHFKQQFANILTELKTKGVTIVMVSHDIEFCAEYADRCALVFDGVITSVDTPREFFKGKNFYTTTANRMARTILPDAVVADDIILALKGKKQNKQKTTVKEQITQKQAQQRESENKKLSPLRIIFGSIFALLFVLTSFAYYNEVDIFNLSHTIIAGINVFHIIAIIEIIIAFLCFFYNTGTVIEVTQVKRDRGKITKRTIVATLLILLLIPLTICFGVFFLENRKYYFISLLVIVESMIPFCMLFEWRKPKARELIVISVMCAIAVAGRSAFFMIPQFKPVIALVIIAGVCFGGETGFLVGCVTAFVSNFFFGQGPWTPWQMFALGVIGFLAGIIFKKGIVSGNRLSLCIFGFFSTVVIYGGIMNPASVIMAQSKINMQMIVSALAVGLPFDLVHATGTAFFLWCISGAMIEKFERVKIKYGLVQR